MWQRTFEYKKIGAFWRPIIPISLKHKRKELNYAVLLDSGSDINILHSEIAAALDIDFNALNTMPFGGIHKEGKGSMQKATIEVSVDNYEFTAPIFFSPDISPYGYGIVGQRGFFDRFKVCFDLQVGKIKLEKCLRSPY